MIRIFDLNIGERYVCPVAPTEEHIIFLQHVCSVAHKLKCHPSHTSVKWLSVLVGIHTTKHKIAFHFRSTFAKVLCVKYAVTTEYEFIAWLPSTKYRTTHGMIHYIKYIRYCIKNKGISRISPFVLCEPSSCWRIIQSAGASSYHTPAMRHRLPIA